MYQEEYERWLAADLEDADLNPELRRKKQGMETNLQSSSWKRRRSHCLCDWKN